MQNQKEPCEQDPDVNESYSRASPAYFIAMQSMASQNSASLAQAANQKEVSIRAWPLKMSDCENWERALIQNPGCRKTLEQWASYLRISPRTLTRSLQREAQLSFQTWRDQIRTFSALPMLAEKRPLANIAAELGYESASSFTAMFKRVTGRLPSRYFETSLHAWASPTHQMRTPLFTGGGGIYFAGSPYNFLQFLVAHPPNFVTQSLTFNQKNPTAIENVFSANPSSANITPQTLASHMPDVYAEEFNLLVERSFARSYTLEVGYVGEVGKHASVRVNANQPIAASAGSDILNIRPYSYAGDVFGQYNMGYSNSNALIAKAVAHLPGGSRVIGSYTWSKNMNISDGDRNTIENYNRPQDYYAVAAWDRPNHLNLGVIGQLPFGHGQRFLITRLV